MNSSSIFAQRLKESRQKQNLTQKELAEKIGTAAATISAYENVSVDKRKGPTLENAAAIANVLNVSLDWLCGLSNSTDTDKKNEDEYIPLIVILKEIIDITTLGCTIEVCDRMSSDLQNYSFAQISISQDEIVEFLRSWEKICDLYDSKTISKDMRDDWINGAMNKYSDYYIDSNGCISDGTMPF